MRNIMIFAAIMVGLGTFMAQMADRMTPALGQYRPAPEPPRSRCAAGRRPVARSTFRATPAAISRPKAGSTASASASWSIPARR